MDVADVYVGCIVYAHDLLLMSASLHNLQLMIDICYSELEKLDAVFNPSKCQVTRVGNKLNNKPTSCGLHVIGSVISVVSQLNYLGLHIMSAMS